MERTSRAGQTAGVLLISVASVMACDGPLRPLPIPPGGQVTEYMVSGVVTDADGRPAAGASVHLSADPGANAVHRTTAGSDGTYQFRFYLNSPPPSVIRAFTAQNDSWTIRPLDWTAQSTIVKNLHLRGVPALSAGEGTTVTIEADSSLCNWEFGSSVTTLCEWFTVASAAVGTLRVDARPVDAAGLPARLGLDNAGAFDTVSLLVPASVVNGRFWFNLAVPVNAAPQRYVVTTTLLGNH